MKLCFLRASDGTPLTKQYHVDSSGKISTSPYPNVAEFNSRTAEIAGLEDFYEEIKKGAAAGECLLKGMLDRPITGERRKGRTDAYQPTNWLCLDLDFDEGYTDIDDFLADLGMGGVSYIFQHSSSSGIIGKAGLRGHVFVLLSHYATPQQLKLWLKHQNLFRNRLQTHLRLTASGYSLRWPLDITTCQNDKLLYIAPPACYGDISPDDVEERIVLCSRGVEEATISLNLRPAAIEEAERTMVEELRQMDGLPRRKPRFKNGSCGVYIENPEQAVVTGVKSERGFVYLNLNGGDSWAYFFPEENPEYLHNFKDEPIVPLSKIAPDFYASVIKNRQRLLLKEKTGTETAMATAFHHAPSDTYHTLLYDPVSGFAQIHQIARTNLKDFFMQFDMEMPEAIHDWTMEFNPQNLNRVDLDRKWVNMFKPTDYMTQEATGDGMAIPPIIDKVLSHVLVDEETKRHFINWLAYVFRVRGKTGTAWLLHGTQGTGKGLLYSQIIAPLLGETHCFETTIERFDDAFNSNFEYNLLTFVDEANVVAAGHDVRTLSKLKNLITEREIVIRGMRKNPYSVPSFTNFIFASNVRYALPLEPNDRRMNVAPRQEVPIDITTEEIMHIEKELPQFAEYLHYREIDFVAVRTVLDNKHRRALIEATMKTTDVFFDALMSGDLVYFAQFLKPAKVRVLSPDNAYPQFVRSMVNWASAALLGEEILVTRDEIAAAYSHIQGTMASPNKFAKMCKLSNVPLTMHVEGEDFVEGVMVRFKGPEPILNAIVRRGEHAKHTVAG